MLFAAAAPAFAVVPSLTPVIVALVPQLLLLLATALLVLVRPRTWIRAAVWSARHPLHALAGLAVAGGLGWGGMWLFSGSNAAAAAAAAAAAWEPPKPACGYEGQRGGPGHTYASDGRGADPVGPNLEPDVRWIRTEGAVTAVVSDGTRAYTVSPASAGKTIIAAWAIADGKRAWSRDLVGEPVGLPLVTTDGSDLVVVPCRGERGGSLMSIERDSGVAHDVDCVVIPTSESACRPGTLVMPTAVGLAGFRIYQGRAGEVARGTTSALWTARGCDRDWTMMTLDEQARVYSGNGHQVACVDRVEIVKELWRWTPGGRVGAPTWSAGWLYVARAPEGNADPELVCLDPETPDGAVAWRLPLPGLRVETLPAAGRTRLVVPLQKPAGAALAQVDTVRRSLVREIPLKSAPAQPVVLADAGDGAVFIADENGRVSRVALKDGSITWTVELGTRPNGPMILADGVLLVPTDKGVAVLE